jgi:cyclase
LVIDSNINGAMAQQIQNAVRNVTDKPILYVVNTNYHGDHTFGNYAFPAQTKIVAHHKTAEAMRDFEAEKSAMIRAVSGNASVIDGVKLRLPDVTFKESLSLDLGGRSVELHHFGHGNTPGDTVVYVPEAKTAWTGNLLLGEKTIPWAIEGKMQAYQKTIQRMANTLDIKTIVPGHVLISDHTLLDIYAQYLEGHIQSVRNAVDDGKSSKETLAALPLAETYLAPKNSALAPARGVFQGFHRCNVKKTYEEMKYKHQ